MIYAFILPLVYVKKAFLAFERVDKGSWFFTTWYLLLLSAFYFLILSTGPAVLGFSLCEMNLFSNFDYFSKILLY